MTIPLLVLYLVFISFNGFFQELFAGNFSNIVVSIIFLMILTILLIGPIIASKYNSAKGMKEYRLAYGNDKIYVLTYSGEEVVKTIAIKNIKSIYIGVGGTSICLTNNEAKNVEQNYLAYAPALLRTKYYYLYDNVSLVPVADTMSRGIKLINLGYVLKNIAFTTSVLKEREFDSIIDKTGYFKREAFNQDKKERIPYFIRYTSKR